MRPFVLIAVATGCGSTPAPAPPPPSARVSPHTVPQAAQRHDPAYGTLRLSGAETLTADADAIASKLADNDTSLIGIATVHDEDADISISFRIAGEPMARTYTELAEPKIEVTSAGAMHHYAATTGTLVLTAVERTGHTFADKLWTIHGTFTSTLAPTQSWDHHAVQLDVAF